MNTQQLADDLKVHYQTVSRARRAILKAEGLYTKDYKRDEEYSPELEAKVRTRVEALHRGPKKPLKSTAQQRREWSDVWATAFLNANPPQWIYFAVVVASIEHSKNPGWLTSVRGDGSITGNLVLGYAFIALPEDQLSPSSFTRWLKDSGFSALPF